LFSLLSDAFVFPGARQTTPGELSSRTDDELFLDAFKVYKWLSDRLIDSAGDEISDDNIIAFLESKVRRMPPPAAAQPGNGFGSTAVICDGNEGSAATVFKAVDWILLTVARVLHWNDDELTAEVFWIKDRNAGRCTLDVAAVDDDWRAHKTPFHECWNLAWWCRYAWNEANTGQRRWLNYLILG
jgi:hypothetical protein